MSMRVALVVQNFGNSAACCPRMIDQHRDERSEPRPESDPMRAEVEVWAGCFGQMPLLVVTGVTPGAGAAAVRCDPAPANAWAVY